MGLIFVPASDLSTSASEATSITSIDFEFILAGEISTKALRVGNRHTFPGSFTVSSTSDLVRVLPAEGYLTPDEISDTISVEIVVPVDMPTGPQNLDLIANFAGNEYTLRLEFEAVGVNVARDSEYPERRTSFTDQISDTIIRAAEPLRLLTFTPIPFDPSDKRIVLDFSRRRKLDIGGDHKFISQNVGTQLDPTNPTWGYVRSEAIILGSWQDEFEAIQVEFESLNTVMTYTGTAQLYVPAEFEFPRMWGLFNVGNDHETDQYKRTVYIVERRGEFWGVHNVYTRWRGNEIAYREIDLVQITPRAMGSPDFYNPFAWTFRAEQDKPYAMFSIDPPNLATALTGNGSNASNTSALDSSGVVIAPNPSMMANTSDAVVSPNSSDEPVEETPEPATLVSATLRPLDGELDLVFSAAVSFDSLPSQANLIGYTPIHSWGASGLAWTNVTATSATLPVENVGTIQQAQELDFNNAAGYVTDATTGNPVASVTNFTLNIDGTPVAALSDATLKTPDSELDLVFSDAVTFLSVPTQSDLKAYTSTQYWVATGGDWFSVNTLFATLPMEVGDDVGGDDVLDFDNSAGYIIDDATGLPVASVADFAIEVE